MPRFKIQARAQAQSRAQVGGPAAAAEHCFVRGSASGIRRLARRTSDRLDSFSLASSRSRWPLFCLVRPAHWPSGRNQAERLEALCIWRLVEIIRPRGRVRASLWVRREQLASQPAGRPVSQTVEALRTDRTAHQFSAKLRLTSWPTCEPAAGAHIFARFLSSLSLFRSLAGRPANWTLIWAHWRGPLWKRARQLTH